MSAGRIRREDARASARAKKALRRRWWGVEPWVMAGLRAGRIVWVRKVRTGAASGAPVVTHAAVVSKTGRYGLACEPFTRGPHQVAEVTGGRLCSRCRELLDTER